MPGISFLFKKRFHPMRTDNQKRLFIAEESRKQESDRERELAEQVLKERELLSYEGLGQQQSGGGSDPRASSLRFMYSAPQSKDGKEKKNTQHLLEPPKQPELDEHGDDEQVRAFKRKLMMLTNPALAKNTASSEEQASDTYPNAEQAPSHEDDIDREEEEGAADEEKQKKPLHHQSALEKAAGRRQRPILTGEEQAERHPLLKNAPVEGSYTKSIQLKHKPFNAVIRNIRCARCGEWGHQTGDRECVLRNYNPNDYARQLREDPMSAAIFQSNKQSADFEIDPNDSDPETTFLNSLSRREKKLLLRKLQMLGNGHSANAEKSTGKKRRRSGSKRDHSDSDSDSSESSSSSSSSSSTSSSSSSDESSIKSNKRSRKHDNKDQERKK